MPAPNEQDPQLASDEVGTERAKGTDDVRRQFQEALTRKSGRGHGTTTGGSGGGPAVPHGGSGPAKAQRTFRRKSGG